MGAVRQKKTGQPVKEQTRETVDSYIGAASKKPASSSLAAEAVGIDR